MKKPLNKTKQILQSLFRLKAWVLTGVILLGLLTITDNALAQTNTVRGRVTNATGEPVVGASVQVKGTQTGTTTDNAGNFTIAAARGAVLVVSSVNYATSEISVGNNNTVNVTLAASTDELNEVVVIGYGTQKKK
ncbi:MAG TPA: SusC/RagA family protein, partial [Chitinophagaceae bacterium]|nr:SusC/RagA family protein [Chitinophagaceae bacterium]